MGFLDSRRQIGEMNSGVIPIAGVSNNDIRNLAGSGLTTIISAAQNTAGLILRSLVVTTGGGDRLAMVYIGGHPMIKPELRAGTDNWSLGTEWLLRDNEALEIHANAGGCRAYATWTPMA